jgi:exosortase
MALWWIAFMATLASDWNLYPQYGYGWFVVPLAAFLLWRRWEDRPEPAVPSFPKLCATAGILALVGLGLGRLCNSANEDWRLAKALVAASVVGFTLMGVYLSGGRSWLRHFGFPILFALSALPWSKPFEDALTNRLMPLVASLSVDALWIFDIPALRQGNLIQLSSGMLGVDEACSGIRSLQGTLMASLFLGEYLRLSPFRRLLMVGVGIAFAFACNVVRAIVLALIAAKKGVEAVDTWHDSAGLSILLACVAGLWVLGLFLVAQQRRSKARRIAEIAMATGMPPIVDTPPRSSTPAPLPPRAWVMAALVALIAMESARELWFRSHSFGKNYQRLWAADWSALPPTKESHEIPDRIREILGYDAGAALSWTGDDGLEWIGYDFRWNRGNDFIRDVQYHRPDICLPSSGRRLARSYGIEKIEVHGQNLFFKSYLFDEGNQDTHVFQIVAEDQLGDLETNMVTEENSRSYRIKRVLQGRREYPGRQVINLYIRGVKSHAEATQAVKRLLGQVVKPVR